ncbi:MAG: rRNA adenine N(6)-methyltransferase family protein [Desulfurococcales archaeon]|nr:rRNA adenine N(6)-methyltransferase family protein [Desulfurococcales archaeon]
MRVPPLPREPRNLLSWLRSVLRLHGKRPLQRLGQVFLVHPDGVKLFASAAGEHLEPPILEVGVGTGHLAYYVAGRVGWVVGVEIDHALLKIAGEVLHGSNVYLVHGDGVECAEGFRVSGVYSNTPYNISSRLIASGARNNSVKALVLGLQLEVAQRVLAEPGSREYGRLTLLAKRYFSVKELGRLPRSWYYPRPEVHGSLVLFQRIRPWTVGDECYERLTACLFTGRNKLADKMASKCLGVERSVLTRIAGKRVRDLTVEDVEWLLEKAGGCTKHH